MKPTTKDTIKGVLHEAEGEIKQTIGHVLGRHDIEAKGRKEKIAGRIERRADPRKQP